MTNEEQLELIAQARGNGVSNPNPALMELPSSTLEAIERKHGQSEALRIAKLPAVEQHAELHRLIQLEKEGASND